MTPSTKRAATPTHRKLVRRPQPRRARKIAPAVDIVVDSTLWRSRRDAKALLHWAITEAAAAVSASDGEVAVVLTDDSAIRALNRDWRRKDAPTNVLSFPLLENPSPRRGPGKRRANAHRAKTRNRPCLFGDIVIAYETTEREALAERKPFAHHLAHLAVHGFLHLVGYDHEGDSEAEAMEELETAILARMGVPDPYVTR
jgi:probable rRNA maturation factor